MQGPLDFATYDFLYSALLFMKTDGEENPEIKELTDTIIECIEKTFNIQPKYFIRVCRDAVDLAADVKWDQFKQPPLEFKGFLKKKASDVKEDPSEKPPSKPLFEVFLEKKKAAKGNEAGDCAESDVKEDPSEKPPSKPLFEVFLEKKKAAKGNEAGDCTESGTSQDDTQKSEDVPK